MNSNSNKKFYEHFTCKEFLEDDFFIRSMRFPTADSEAFWSDFADFDPSNLKEFNLAREFMTGVQMNYSESIPEEEIKTLKNKIDESNRKIRKTKSRRLVYISLSASAACLALLLSVFLYKKNSAAFNPKEIASFANRAKPDSNNSQILLVFSKDKTVDIDKKETNITYNSTQVKTEKGNLDIDAADKFNQLIVPRGKRTVLTLSDGTRIWVNACTRVVYPPEFKDKYRQIYVDGEVYLEVAKNPDRPFYVKTKDMTVRVLGTKFNVNAYESEPEHSVVLAEGSVQVNNADNSSEMTVLKPNQMFSLNNNKGSVRAVAPMDYISWIYGYYKFDNESLSDVVKKLSVYYGVNIYTDESLGRIKCSGKVDLKDNIETVISDLSSILSISYTHDTSSSTYRMTMTK